MEQETQLSSTTNQRIVRRATKLTSLALVCFAATLTISSASAHQYTCQSGPTTRLIAVEHEPNQPLPCSVRYEKPDEDNSVTFPWHANTTRGFCEDKADQLAEKLTSYGWQCERTKSHD